VTPVAAWSAPLGGTPAGVALAREARQVLAWSPSRLVLFNHDGRTQAEHRPTSPLTAAAVADDGTAFAAADEADHVAWLAPDLTPRWQTVLAHRPTALALDSFGQYLAVADRRGGVSLYDRTGRRVETFTAVRPLRFLGFAAAAPLVAAAADFGLVTVLEPFGRGWVWQDRPVTHCGGLAVGPKGEPVVAACFSEGLRRYDAFGKSPAGAGPAGPCQAVGLNYDATLTVTADLAGWLRGFDATGAVRFEYDCDRPVAALAVAALGERVYVTLTDGSVRAVDVGG
jgi:hypothetical protein